MAEKNFDYGTLEIQRSRELTSELEKRLKEKKTAIGKQNTLRHVILHSIVGGRFEMATKDLDLYVDMQVEFPGFRKRAERFIRHCHDIIHAIEAKKNFPGLASLPLAKQQELLESVIDHFEELKHYLKKIEVIEKDVKLDDMRSTAWILKSFSYSVGFIFVAAMLKEFFSGLEKSTSIVLDDTSQSVINWLYSLF